MRRDLSIDVNLLYLPEHAVVDHETAIVSLEPGDRVRQQIETAGGREVYVVEVVRGWSYPHPSHEMGSQGCLGCGTAHDGIKRVAALDEPCANVPCRRCGELNGLMAPACERHGIGRRVEARQAGGQ